MTELTINYNLNDLEDTLLQNIASTLFFRIYFEKLNHNGPKLKKSNKKNILKLKNKLENIKRIYEVNFIDFCIYKELIFLCENLKSRFIIFSNCTLEEDTEKELLKFMNNCRTVTVEYKMDKILFNVIKNCFGTVKYKDLDFVEVEYKSIKNIFFGIYLSRLKLSNLETSEREMNKILKSLHGTINLRHFIYINEKAHGLIYNRKNINNKKKIRKSKELKEEVDGKNSVELTFKVEKANEIFLNLLPNWINETQIESIYKQEDVKYLFTKFYEGGILNSYEFIGIRYFKNLTKQKDIDLLDYIKKLK